MTKYFVMVWDLDGVMSFVGTVETSDSRDELVSHLGRIMKASKIQVHIDAFGL